MDIAYRAPYPEPDKLQPLTRGSGAPTSLDDMIETLNANVEKHQPVALYLSGLRGDRDSRRRSIVTNHGGTKDTESSLAPRFSVPPWFVSQTEDVVRLDVLQRVPRIDDQRKRFGIAT